MYGVPQAGLTVPAITGQVERGTMHRWGVQLSRLHLCSLEPRLSLRATFLSLVAILVSEEQTPDAPNGVAEVANQLLTLSQMRGRGVDAGEL